MHIQHPIYKYDVYYQLLPRWPQKGDQYEMFCSLEDGYAAFLQPLFAKLNDETGKTIVFINGATFGGSDLKVLSQLISTVRKRMVAKEESWDVLLGYRELSKGKKQGVKRVDIYGKVTKYKMNAFLDQIDAAIQKAKFNDTYVRFNFWGGGG